MQKTSYTQKIQTTNLLNYIMTITSDAVSLQVDPLQRGYLRQLFWEDGELVIGQTNAGQVL